MNILGVRIDNLSKKEILEKISHFLNGEKFYRISTLNPEIILKAQEDREYRDILNNCDLNVADGIGIKIAFWRFGEKLKFRFPGADLMVEILKIANEKKMKIFLVANSGGLSSWEETKKRILKIYPDLIIDGVDLDKNLVTDHWSQVTGDVVFCNFGAPYQEKFLNYIKSDKTPHLFNKNRENQPNYGLQNERCGVKIKVAVGVGGSFDYLTGKIKRAPKWMQFFGVEWLWRLILQPKRIKRIWNAAVVFPVKVLCYKKGK